MSKFMVLFRWNFVESIRPEFFFYFSVNKPSDPAYIFQNQKKNKMYTQNSENLLFSDETNAIIQKYF